MDQKRVKITELSFDTENARLHDAKNLDAIKRSLTKFGQQKPLVVDKKGHVIAGNGTLAAAKELGWQEIEVVYTKLDKTKAKAYAIADNRTAELAAWDELMLGKHLASLQLEGFDIEDIGFSEADIPTPEVEGNIEDDKVPEVEQNIHGVKRGDIWLLGKHRLMCGDSTSKEDVERLMDGQKADMVFTDPPYGVSYQSKNKLLNRLQTPKGGLETPIHGDELSVNDLKKIIQAAFNNINAILADKSCYYICSPQGGELGLMMMMMQEACIPCRHMIIWVKNAPVFSVGRLDYDYKHEPILFGWSQKRTHQKSTQLGQWKSSVWDCDREPNKLHPTMKPIAIIENAIVNSCPNSGNVADLFCGSGSTLIAAEKTNRKCYGMEIDPHYCSVIIERWQQFTNQKASKCEVSHN